MRETQKGYSCCTPIQLVFCCPFAASWAALQAGKGARFVGDLGLDINDSLTNFGNKYLGLNNKSWRQELAEGCKVTAADVAAAAAP